MEYLVYYINLLIFLLFYQQAVLGGQVCYLPSKQECPILESIISPYWAGNKPALPAFLADFFF